MYLKDEHGVGTANILHAQEHHIHARGVLKTRPVEAVFAPNVAQDSV